VVQLHCHPPNPTRNLAGAGLDRISIKMARFRICQNYAKSGTILICSEFGVCLLQSVNVADAVRESLEKDPSERTDYDVEIILNAIQHLQVHYCLISYQQCS